MVLEPSAAGGKITVTAKVTGETNTDDLPAPDAWSRIASLWHAQAMRKRPPEAALSRQSAVGPIKQIEALQKGYPGG